MRSILRWSSERLGTLLLLVACDSRAGLGLRQGDESAVEAVLVIANTPATFGDLAPLFTALGCADAPALGAQGASMLFAPLGQNGNQQPVGPMLAVADCPD